jgi:hypothetical protein
MIQIHELRVKIFLNIIQEKCSGAKLFRQFGEVMGGEARKTCDPVRAST